MIPVEEVLGEDSLSSSKRRSKYKSKNKHSGQNQPRTDERASLESSSKVEDYKEEKDRNTVSDLKEEQGPALQQSPQESQEASRETVVMFFKDANAYIEHFESVLSQSQGDIRVNVVIRSQDSISTKKVPSNIFLYTGEVWWNIHKNRELEGYYKKVVNIDG